RPIAVAVRRVGGALTTVASVGDSIGVRVGAAWGRWPREGQVERSRRARDAGDADQIRDSAGDPERDGRPRATEVVVARERREVAEPERHLEHRVEGGSG